MDGNGSIHGMSLTVGKLIGSVEAIGRSVEHLNNNFKMRDDEANRHREELHRKMDAMHGTVSSVQQDVAEMKNELTETREKIDKIEQQKPVVMAAVSNVEELMKFRAAYQLQKQRDLGWWDAIKGLFTVTRIVGGAIWGGLFYLLGKLIFHGTF